MMTDRARNEPNWHRDVFFGIHYDLHAKATDTELGREVTATQLRARLERIRPDWIQCDCKGHPGYTSWPTEVGSASPGIVQDALRIHRDVTRELGIRLGMHYSGVIDHRALELHPEWAQVDAAGKRSTQATCRLSPYVEQLMIPQLVELIEKYDVDGFWVDGENWGSAPCWCEACRAEFKQRTGMDAAPLEAGQPHWDAWLAFHRDLFTEYVTRYTEAVHAAKPECLVCSNWMYTVRQPEPVTAPVDYLSGDYTPNWGAARAALEGRMLDNRGMTWDLMVWGFTRNYDVPGSPWAMKPALHLQQEVSGVVALGGAVMVYAKPHRSGWLTGWEHATITEVAEFCRARRDLCVGSTSASEAAVLHGTDHYYAHNAPLFNYGTAIQPVEGALSVLLETHRSTDLVTDDRLAQRLPGLKLLVLPEQTRIRPEVAAQVTRWVESGGSLLASGAHLADELPELTGCLPAGEPEERQVMLPVGREAVQLSGTWRNVRPQHGAEVLLPSLRNLEPDQPVDDEAFVTGRSVGKGRVVAVHGALFQNYFCANFPRIRRLVRDLVDGFAIDWRVTLAGSSRIEMILREKDGELVVHLLNRGAAETLSPQRTIVDELLPVENVTLSIDTKSHGPVRGVALFSGRAVDGEQADGRVLIQLPPIAIHEAVRVQH